MVIVQNSFGDIVVFDSDTGAYAGMAMNEGGKWFSVVAEASQFPVPARDKKEAFSTLMLLLVTRNAPMQ